MTADQLRECPFCGDHMAMVMREDAFNFAVLCAHVAGKGGCGMRGPYRGSEEGAIKAWNTRPTAVASHAKGEAVAWLEVEPGVSLDQASGEHGMLVHSMKVHIGRKKPAKSQDANGLFPLYTHPPRSGDEAPFVKLGREIFRFNSFEQWVNKARSWFKTAGVSSTQFVCIDATGHICGMGKQFMSARDRNAFPVIVYHIEPEQDAAMAARGGSDE